MREADVSQHHQSSPWTLCQLHHTSHTSHFVSCVNVGLCYAVKKVQSNIGKLCFHVKEDLSHIGGRFVSLLMLLIYSHVKVKHNWESIQISRTAFLKLYLILKDKILSLRKISHLGGKDILSWRIRYSTNS